MTIDLNVVRAGVEDAGALHDLLNRQFEEHAIPVDAARLEEAIRSVLQDDSLGFILVARVAEGAIGTCYVSFTWSLEHAGKSAWLEELYVVPERRGRRVGESLLHAALRKAEALGCAAVDLEVDRSQARAENLYRRAGFCSLPRGRWVKRLGGSPA